MSENTKNNLARWLPFIVFLATSAAQLLYIGKWVGTLETRLDANSTADVEDRRIFERLHNEYITRVEWQAHQASDDKIQLQYSEHLQRIENKLDRLIERSGK